MRKGGNKIIGQAKELREIEGMKGISEKDIVRVVRDTVEEVKSSPEIGNLDIEVEYKGGLGRVRGDYSLKKFFSFIIDARSESTDCAEIKISVDENYDEVIVRFEDDGEKQPREVEGLVSGEPYKGKTSGVAGFRYYVIGEIVSHNEGRIEFGELEIGGARFDVHLKKARQ